jgi:hypothetical protein
MSDTTALDALIRQSIPAIGEGLWLGAPLNYIETRRTLTDQIICNAVIMAWQDSVITRNYLNNCVWVCDCYNTAKAIQISLSLTKSDYRVFIGGMDLAIEILEFSGGKVASH